jgi:hypothetical protein
MMFRLLAAYLAPIALTLLDVSLRTPLAGRGFVALLHDMG